VKDRQQAAARAKRHAELAGQRRFVAWVFAIFMLIGVALAAFAAVLNVVDPLPAAHPIVQGEGNE
jgi:hypothetical protein